MVISRTERKKTGPLPPNFGVFALCFFLFAVLSLASALSLGLGWRSFNDFFLARGIDPERDIAENLLQAYRFLEELACAIPFAAGIAFSLMFFFYVINRQREDIGIRILLGQRPLRTFLSLAGEVVLAGFLGEAAGIGLAWPIDVYGLGYQPPLYYLGGYVGLTIIGGLASAAVVTGSLHRRNPYRYLRSDL